MAPGASRLQAGQQQGLIRASGKRMGRPLLARPQRALVAVPRAAAATDTIVGTVPPGPPRIQTVELPYLRKVCVGVGAWRQVGVASSSDVEVERTGCQ